MSSSANLYRLQQVDSQLDQIRYRIAEIDKSLSEDAQLQQAQQNLEAANKALSEDQKRLRLTENAVQDLKIKIEQTDAMLYSGKVHNPKELQDLEAESSALKRHMTILEDRELEAMLIVETSEQQLNVAKQNLNTVQSQVSSKYALLNGERLTLKGQMEILAVEREAAINMTNTDELIIYEQLRKQRRGIAVAKAIDKSCSACGSALTPALIQQAVTSPLLVKCPTCSRIIYPG